MTHLEDGTLQAFLDDELPARTRAEVAEHLLACESCHARQEELLQANTLFAQSISVLDVEPPSTGPAAGPLRRHAPAATGSFVKAAGLVLALAAAASAAVPGSPVRAWVAQVLEPSQPTPEATGPRPGSNDGRPLPPPAPAGVSINPASGPVVVAIAGLEDAVIRLEGAPGSEASVSVLGGERDPVFRTGAGRLEVRDGAGGEVRVRLPLGIEGARLEVDGELYAETVAGTLELHVAADTVGGAIVWR